jgi:SAM-dependent methyltransferase
VYEINKIIKKNNVSLNKYLDIGCGTGIFAISLGKILKLDKNSIFGIDMPNFSEKGDWGREKNTNKFVFNELKLNKPYPFEDNTFELITMKMVLHHVQNIDFTLKEVIRILKKNAILLIIEHDAFTYADYMINDIEHGCYINVFKTNTFDENFLNLTSNKKKQEKNILGVSKYYNWPELSYLLESYGFRYKSSRPFNRILPESVSASRAFYYLYSLNK